MFCQTVCVDTSPKQLLSCTINTHCPVTRHQIELSHADHSFTPLTELLSDGQTSTRLARWHNQFHTITQQRHGQTCNYGPPSAEKCAFILHSQLLYPITQCTQGLAATNEHCSTSMLLSVSPLFAPNPDCAIVNIKKHVLICGLNLQSCSAQQLALREQHRGPHAPAGRGESIGDSFSSLSAHAPFFQALTFGRPYRCSRMWAAKEACLCVYELRHPNRLVSQHCPGGLEGLLKNCISACT